MAAIAAPRDQAAEEANRKANSESGFAHNAKQNAEDHAKAVAQVRGSVEADFTWLFLNGIDTIRTIELMPPTLDGNISTDPLPLAAISS